MSEFTALEVAGDGDVLSGAALQESVEALKEMAARLDPLLLVETSVDAAQQMGRAQQDLRSLAMSLVAVQIDLLAGQVKVTADHINGAVRYANGVISQVADWRKRVHKIGELLVFFTVLLTGKGANILQAANKLKATLDA